MEWEPFARLFAGYDAAYGTYAATGSPEANGKVQMVKPVSLRGAVTEEMWIAHLEGRRALGIIPIDKNQQAQWGAIDIDIYGMDHLDLIERIKAHGLPLVVCRSKSGGAHAYLFLERAYPAAEVRGELRELAALLGYTGSEIFPKQSRVKWEEEDLGTWLNLPYFGAERTTRYAYDEQGRPLTLEAFLRVVEHRPHLGGWRRRAKAQAPSEQVEGEGPPCLEALYRVGFPEHTRHNGLFAIGVYLRKAFPLQEDWQRLLKEYHDRYFDPPKPADLADVTKSLTKRGYNYKCSEPPIASHCNKPLCLTRRYGVGALNGMPSLIYSGLVKLDSEPPVYFLAIDDIRVRLKAEELYYYNQFGPRVMAASNRMPPMLKQEVWARQLGSLFETMIVVPVAVPNDEAIAKQALLDYVRRGRRNPSGKAVKIEAAAWVPLIDGLDVYVNWMRFVEEYRRRARVGQDVLTVLYRSLGVEETEHPLVQKIRLEKELE